MAPFRGRSETMFMGPADCSHCNCNHIYIYIYISFITLYITLFYITQDSEGRPGVREAVAAATTATVTTCCLVNLVRLNKIGAGFEATCGYSCGGCSLLVV